MAGCGGAARCAGVGAARTELHPQQALVPTSDHLPHARLVAERLLARVLGAPELLAGLRDDALGVHGGRAALGDRLAAAGGQGPVEGDCRRFGYLSTRDPIAHDGND